MIKNIFLLMSLLLASCNTNNGPTLKTAEQFYNKIIENLNRGLTEKDAVHLLKEAQSKGLDLSPYYFEILLSAVKNSKKDVVNKLIDLGMDIDQKQQINPASPKLRFALETAARAGNVEMVAFLISEKKANVQNKNDEGFTTLGIIIDEMIEQLKAGNRNLDKYALVADALLNAGASVKGSMPNKQVLLDAYKAGIGKHQGFKPMKGGFYKIKDTLYKDLFKKMFARVVRNNLAQEKDEDGNNILNLAANNSDVSRIGDIIVSAEESPAKFDESFFNNSPGTGYNEPLCVIKRNSHKIIPSLIQTTAQELEARGAACRDQSLNRGSGVKPDVEIPQVCKENPPNFLGEYAEKYRKNLEQQIATINANKDNKTLIENVKSNVTKLYKILALLHHIDRGGTVEAISALNACKNALLKDGLNKL